MTAIVTILLFFVPPESKDPGGKTKCKNKLE